VAARALSDAVLEAARRLGASPALGSWRAYLPPRYRVWSLTRFGYVIVYDATTDPVQILRIVHAARDLPRLLAHLGGS
jgi:toxin ParE1/3/4